MHWLDSQTVSEYISTIVPDDNEKFSINGKLDILLMLPVKVVWYAKPPICYNKRVKKLYARRFATSYRVCFLLEFEATSHNVMFVGR